MALSRFSETRDHKMSMTTSTNFSLSLSLARGTELSGMCVIAHDVLLVGLLDVGCDLFGSESDPSCALSHSESTLAYHSVVDALYMADTT